jgi:hypothetical protein
VRILPALSLLAGLVPGLLVLAFTNEVKFGIFSPFTYGVAGQGSAVVVASYLGMVAAGMAGIALAWAATRPTVRTVLASRRWWLIVVAVAIVAAILAAPPLRNLAVRLADGTWQLVVDLRVRSPDAVEWGVSRTPGGGVAYDTALKKSLLQNCPWLVVLLLPLARWLRRPQGDAAVAPLFLAIGGFVAFYAYFAWHGGFSLNMRYFLTFLPFASVLGAYGWKCLAANVAPPWRLAAAVAGFSSVVAWLALLLQDSGLGIEPQLLNLPLVLAGLLLATLLAGAIPSGKVRKIAAGAGLTVTAMGFAWATAAALLYDLPRSRNIRADSQQIAAAIAPLLEPDSILFSRYASTVSNLIGADRIRLAFPRNDDFADFRRLVALHLDKGNPVYLAFNDEYLTVIAERKLLEGLELKPVYEGRNTFVARVVRRGGS